MNGDLLIKWSGSTEHHESPSTATILADDLIYKEQIK